MPDSTATNAASYTTRWDTIQLVAAGKPKKVAITVVMRSSSSSPPGFDSLCREPRRKRQ
jgi:hypothetical protein